MHSLRSAAVQYTNYGTGGAFELPTQSGTLRVTLTSLFYYYVLLMLLPLKSPKIPLWSLSMLSK